MDWGGGGGGTENIGDASEGLNKIVLGIPTTIKTMGVNITTIDYLRVFNHRNWVNHYFNAGGSPGSWYPGKSAIVTFLERLVVGDLGSPPTSGNQMVAAA